MTFHVDLEGILFVVDYMSNLIVYQSTVGKWIMKLEPYLILCRDRRVKLPRPCGSYMKEAATSWDIYAEYAGIEGTAMRIYTRISIDKMSGELSFEVRAEDDFAGEIEFLSYPSAWTLVGDEAYTVLPRMQGELVPQYSDLKVEHGQIFERSAYMPIFGQVKDGSAYIAIFDTPYDASYNYDEGAVTPLWRSSLGTLSYQRRILYRFFNGDYNDIAKAYRTYVKEKGQLITLRAKAALNPRVEKLAGCPIIHTGITRHVSPDSRYYRPDDPEYNDNTVTFDERAAQIKRLKELGLKRAYTHFDGWGVRGYDNLHPSPLPPSPAAGGAEGMKRLMDAVKGAGYLFGIHDQYRDYYYDAPFFTMDEARQNLDGSHSHNHIWHGGHYAYLCPQNALKYVKNNYLQLEKMGIYPDSSYLDVFSLAELDQCFNPNHRVSREGSVKYRRECLDWLTARGIIPSSEETLDCILPSQVLCHHAPFNKEEIASARRAIPIPLFNLVYHDCVVIPWIGLKGENGESGLPEGMSTYLYAILCANPVYCPIDADRQTIADVEEACEISGKLMYTEMLRHELITPDGMKQRAYYADGSVIEVDMEKASYSIAHQ